MARDKTRMKRKERKNIATGVAHVNSSFNNTKILISDVQGNAISWSSAGTMGFKGSRKSTPYAAQMAAEDAGKKAQEHGVRTLAECCARQCTDRKVKDRDRSRHRSGHREREDPRSGEPRTGCQNRPDRRTSRARRKRPGPADHGDHSARARRGRGLALTQAEATALVADAICEAAREITPSSGASWRSAWRVMAPIRHDPGDPALAPAGRSPSTRSMPCNPGIRRRSTRRVGAARRSFISGSNEWPPASNLASSPFSWSMRTASSRLSGAS